MWQYQGSPIEEIGDAYIGFVYLITNLSNDKKYIGKKLLKFTKTKMVKGKKKRVKVDSDWKTYYGSNKMLQEDVKVLGENQFTREILRFCVTKGECSYYELREQIDKRALERNDFYNDYIYVRINRSHIPKQ